MVVVKTSATIEGLQTLETLEKIIVEAFGHEIAQSMVENTEDAIKNEIFQSQLGFPITGIVDLGEYLKSYDIDENDPYHVIIGSTDENAAKLEFGTTAEENVGVKDSEIIEWVKRKKFAGRRYISIGKAIAKSLRTIGMKEKPAFRRGIDITKTNGEEIKNRTVENLKNKLNR